MEELPVIDNTQADSLRWLKNLRPTKRIYGMGLVSVAAFLWNFVNWLGTYDTIEHHLPWLIDHPAVPTVVILLLGLFLIIWDDQTQIIRRDTLDDAIRRVIETIDGRLLKQYTNLGGRIDAVSNNLSSTNTATTQTDNKLLDQLTAKIAMDYYTLNKPKIEALVAEYHDAYKQYDARVTDNHPRSVTGTDNADLAKLASAVRKANASVEYHAEQLFNITFNKLPAPPPPAIQPELTHFADQGIRMEYKRIWVDNIRISNQLHHMLQQLTQKENEVTSICRVLAVPGYHHVRHRPDM